MKPRIFILVHVLVCLAGSFGQAQQSGKNVPMAKLTHSLVKLHDQYATYLAQRSAASFNFGDPLITLVDNRVVVDAVASGDVNELKADLESLGMQQAVAFGRMVSGQLPVSALPAVAGMASLQFAQPAAAITNAGSVTSQGDQAMRSNVARATFGVDGSGVTVGALSDSFNCLGGAAADVASGDLSPVNVVQEQASCSGATDEGRAMLQIVHDVAPGASLAFASAFNGLASFATNIQSLAAAGAKVIVDDVIYFAEPFFQDGILAQAVNNAVSGEVAYFSSASNQARQSYESVFRAGGVFAQNSIPSAPGAPSFFGGTAHDFDPGGGNDVFQRITVPNGAGFIMVLQWDSPAFSVSGAPGSLNDLDVYVLNANANQVVAGANIDNLGNDPIEILSFTNTTGVTADFNIMIVEFAGPNPGLIKYVLFNLGGTIQEFATNSGTLYGHANAAGAEAVGAAAYFNTPEFGVSPPVLNSFSSSGTTPILFDQAGNRFATPELRAKPEIVAPDGVDTTFFGNDVDGTGFPNFFGTSASAPHAAAVAALMFQLRPTLTPAKIYASLENTAIDMGAPGFDNNSGFGLIQADKALAAALSTAIDIDGDGKSDIGIYRDGAWSIIRSSDGGVTNFNWGGASWTPVVADYDGDGKADIAVYNGNGLWSIVRSSDGGNTLIGWSGAANDIPVPADYDGDGKADLAVYNTASAGWSIIRSSDGGLTYKAWGGPAWIPVPADYDGDGKVDIAVYNANGLWSIVRSSDGGNTLIGWSGAAGDIPVPADYDGDGKADLAVYNTVSGGWSIIRSSDGALTYKVWGGPGWEPVAADYDGDGKADIAVYNASNGLWSIVRSSDGGNTLVGLGGAAQDIPLN